MNYWIRLTDEECSAIMNGMPGGVGGYLKEWGWLTFARVIEERLRLKNAPDAPLCLGMRETLEEARAVLHNHACAADAFADRITRLLETPHSQGD